MDVKIQKDLGNNIKRVREKSNLTQAEVASIARINGNYFARIERGEINLSLQMIRKITKALNIKSSEIMPF